MESVSATDSVPQNDHAVAEPVLVNQFQLQPHTIREELFSGADDRRADEHLKLVNNPVRLTGFTRKLRV